MRHPMRPAVLVLLGLSSLLSTGCSLLNPNSKLNVNRGEYNDEWSAAGAERQNASSGMDHEDAEGINKWWHSPKYRAIERSLGVD